MHGLFGLAGLLGLIAMAFGPRAAAFVAQAILIIGTVVLLWIAFMIMTEAWTATAF